MGTKGAQCSMNTKGALRKILSTLHPNTILNPTLTLTPTPNPQPTPNLHLPLPLPLTLALNLALALTLGQGHSECWGPKWRAMMWQKQP